MRDLAEQINVAPMTVSQVYRELKTEGLIEARPGPGTFVADRARRGWPRGPKRCQLRRRIDALIDEALAMGVRATDLAALVNARLFYRTSLGRRTQVVMVGLFPEATASYASASSPRGSAKRRRSSR